MSKQSLITKVVVTPKSQVMVLRRDSQQQESKQGQIGQIRRSWMNSVMDFLLMACQRPQIKWWGSGGPGDFDYIDAIETNRECRPKCEEIGDDGSNAESEKVNSDPTLPGTGLLTAVRKKALEQGREALKLGVFRSHHAGKIGKKEKSLML
ncbi:hypothetical protein ACJRO7_020888 [Eucalyptus globulus]|uniref:Uncharacterized protein n=1 Tax=Eucalyptus globulus TaxID=34317 RepID=A0ABD3KI43_EUCGL